MFFRGVLSMCVSLLLALAPVAGAGAMSVPQREHHIYQLDFLIFNNIAEGELRLDGTDQPNVKRAELVGRTLGLASWLAGNRIQQYIATMETQSDGAMRSLLYESRVSKRRFGRTKTTRKRFRFDLENRQVVLEKQKNGKFVRKGAFDIPTGPMPVDILTGFYNLRAGVYGILQAGARIEIPTVTSKGLSTIVVNVLTATQRTHQEFFPSKKGMLLQVFLDPEVFETADGGLYLWLDEEGQPSRVIVENVIGLGDVKGHLRKEGADEA